MKNERDNQAINLKFKIYISVRGGYLSCNLFILFLLRKKKKSLGKERSLLHTVTVLIFLAVDRGEKKN